MARVNIENGVGKWVPSVFVVEMDCGASGWQPTSNVAINPKGAAICLRESRHMFQSKKFRITEYTRLEEIENASH